MRLHRLVFVVALASTTFSAGVFAQVKTVPLGVTIQDGTWNSGGTNVQCAICSDGRGEYIDGYQGVAAWLTRDGNLVVQFDTGKQPDRRVYFNYMQMATSLTCLGCAYPATTPQIPFNDGIVPVLSLNTQENPHGTQFTPIQNMRLGNSQSLEAAWIFRYPDNRTEWRTTFHRGLSDYDSSPSAYAVVTCTQDDGNNCTSWEVEPGAADWNTYPIQPYIALLVKALWNKSGTTATLSPQAFLYMPFKLSLRRK